MSNALVSKLPLSESFESAYLEQWGILPLELQGERLRVATSGEPAVEVLEDLEQSYGAAVELVPVTRKDLLEAIRRTYAAAESVVELVRDLGAELGPGADGADDHIADARDLANQP